MSPATVELPAAIRRKEMQIALIDHSYHETTKSTCFFSDILEEIGNVRRFYDDSWCGGPESWKAEFDETAYDLIVVWQVHKAFSALSGKHENVVFVPMYDAMLDSSRFYWNRSFNTAKCLAFSRKLHEEVTRRGATSRYFRYFPDPARYRSVTDFSEIRPFFWYRSKDIAPDLVAKLCSATPIANLAIHNAPDPGQPLLPAPRFPPNVSHIEISTWSADVLAYREALLKSNVFFSPRMREGIGMAFLEAMASGLCVVAPDFPTMNEYIANGTNGILYSLDQTSPLDFSRAQDMGARARETVERGFADWQSSLADLKEFLVTPMLRSESPGHRGMFRLRQRFRL